MRAVTRRQYGETEVLRIEQLPVPEPADGQVLVRIVAAGVNMAEWHMMAGKPTIARLAFGLPRPKNPRLGADVAGIIEKVGRGVTRFAVGDEVLGSALGAWAEFAVAKEGTLHPKPLNVTFEEAAAVPMAGYTALQALRRVGELERRHVAVTGAGGGVGSYAVQLASAGGARVTAVCSAGKAEFVRRLGAHDVIDYATIDPTAGEPRFDAVLDFAGGLPLHRWKRAMKPGGLLVLGGSEVGGQVLGPLARSASAIFVRGIRVVTLLATESGDDLAELARLLETGELRSTLAHTYPLEEAALAVDDLRAAAHPGKLVLAP